MECVLHIGLHKTGSTSIQKFLQQNRQLLLVYNINYLVLNKNNSNPLYSLYCQDPIRYGANKRLGIDTKKKVKRYNNTIKEIFINELTKNNSKQFIISGEDLSFLNYEGVKNLKNDITAYFDDIKIVVYVRNPISTIRSKISHFIANEGWSIDKRISVANKYPDKLVYYKNPLLRYFEIFGKNNVIVKPFDKKYLYKGDVVKDFALSVNISEEIIDHDNLKNENYSFSENALKIFSFLNINFPLFINNKFNIARGKFQKPLRMLLGEIKGEKISISNGMIDNIYNKCADDLTWLYNNTGINFFKNNLIAIKRENNNIQNKELNEEIYLFSNLLLKMLKNNKACDNYYIQKRITKSFKELNQINEKKDLPLNFYGALAELFFIKANFDKALVNFDKMLEFDSKSSLAHMRISQIYAKKENYKKAIEEVKNAIDLENDNPIYYKHLGDLLKQKGDLDGAEQAQKKAIELDPYLASPYIQLSQIYELKDDIELAIEKAYKAIDLNLTNDDYYKYFISLINKIGNKEGKDLIIRRKLLGRKLLKLNQEIKKLF